MSKITCTQCGKGVEKGAPATPDDNLFVCKDCVLKRDSRQIEKEKRINAKLAELFAQGKSYDVAQVTREVEAEMSK